MVAVASAARGIWPCARRVRGARADRGVRFRLLPHLFTTTTASAGWVCKRRRKAAHAASLHSAACSVVCCVTNQDE